MEDLVAVPPLRSGAALSSAAVKQAHEGGTESAAVASLRTSFRPVPKPRYRLIPDDIKVNLLAEIDDDGWLVSPVNQEIDLLVMPIDSISFGVECEGEYPQTCAQAKIRVLVNGHALMAVFDTGAQITAISQIIVARLNLEVHPYTKENPRPNARGVTGDSALFGDGWVKVWFFLMGKPFRHAFHIITNGTFDVILGTDFMASKQIIYDCSDMKIKFHEDFLGGERNGKGRAGLGSIMVQYPRAVNLTVPDQVRLYHALSRIIVDSGR
ncbi:MAG: retropepsin-like domain-containing protein [Acidobacteriota bacterium]|nr:retropepsin-like domain-containing protein [Acidobacteriota bacterium]